jgi:hypothetical protein
MVTNVAFSPIMQVRGPIADRLWTDSVYLPTAQCHNGSGSNGFGSNLAEAPQYGQSYATGARLC